MYMELSTAQIYPLLVAILRSLHVKFYYYDSNYTMLYILEERTL